MSSTATATAPRFVHTVKRFDRVNTPVGPGTVHSTWVYNDRNTVIVTLDEPVKCGVVYETTVAFQAHEIQSA